MKTCPRCAQEQALEGFSRDRRRPDGHDVYCKQCRKAATKRWVQENPERHAAKKRGDPEAEKARNRRWREANPEKAAESKRRAKQKFKTERREEYLMRKRMEQSARRMTGQDVIYGVIVSHDPCSYCGGAGGTIDHVTPIKVGGTNNWSNLTGACRSCNSSKSSRALLPYLLEAA